VAKETNEDILKTIMEKGSPAAQKQAAEALGATTEAPIAEAAGTKIATEAAEVGGAAVAAGGLGALIGKFAGGGVKAAGRGALGLTKVLGKGALGLTKGAVKLGFGAVRTVGTVAAAGALEEVGLEKALPALLASGGLFGGRGGRNKPDNTNPGVAGGTASSASMEALLNQLIIVTNGVLSATKDNNSRLVDISEAIDKQTGQVVGELGQTNNILEQLVASVNALDIGKGGRSTEGGGKNGLLDALKNVGPLLMDGLLLFGNGTKKLLSGLVESAIGLVKRASSFISESLSKLFGKGGAEAAEVGAADLAGKAAGEVATDAAGKVAGEAAADTAGKVAGEAAADTAGKAAGEIATETAGKAAGEAATETAGKVATETAGKVAAEAGAEAVAKKGLVKGAASLGSKAIPLLGDVYMGYENYQESGSLGQAVAAGTGSLLGRLGGGFLGTAAGPVGTFAGEVGGSLGGAYLGAEAYKKVAGWFGGGESTTSANTAAPSMAQAKALENGLTPVQNPSAVPFNKQSLQNSIQTGSAAVSPPPVIVNNINGGGGSASPPPSAPARSSGAVSTAPVQSQIDRVIYGDMYGAGVP